MKVILLSPTIDVTNGYGNITMELCTRLQNIVDLTLLLPRDELARTTKLAKTNILKTLPRFIFNFRDKKIIEYLLWQVPDIKADVYHSLFAFPYAVLAEKMATKTGTPLIVGAQGTYGVEPLTHQPEKFFLKRAYEKAVVIHVPSEFTKEKILKFSDTKTPIEVIHNGVDFTRFQKKYDLSDLTVKFGKGPILLGVGGLKWRKGFDVSIRAVSKLLKIFPKIRYLIVGEGSERVKLEQLITKLKLEENVFLLGERKYEELVKLYQLCNVYLHTPRNDNWNFEGFGIVYLEAAACGKPSVASASGGVSDAVKNGKTGLLVEEGNAVAAAKAIEKLLVDNKFSVNLSKEGRVWAKQHDWSKIVGSMREIYKRYG